MVQYNTNSISFNTEFNFLIASLNFAFLNHHGQSFGDYSQSNKYEDGYKDIMSTYDKDQICSSVKIMTIQNKSLFLIL